MITRSKPGTARRALPPPERARLTAGKRIGHRASACPLPVGWAERSEAHQIHDEAVRHRGFGSVAALTASPSHCGTQIDDGLRCAQPILRCWSASKIHFHRVEAAGMAIDGIDDRAVVD